MENKNRIENFEKEIRLKIRNQTFLNEIDLDQYREWSALAGIIFIDCTFKELDLLGTIFGSCDFENCKFNNLSFRKCQFSNCKFENCQIVNSDLTRAQFDDSNFRNCEFLKSDLTASDFRRCELDETKFKNSNLSLVVEIEKVFNVEEFLDQFDISNSNLRKVRCYLMQTFVLAEDFKLIENEFVLVLKTKKVKTVTKLTTNLISRTKLIHFKELTK